MGAFYLLGLLLLLFGVFLSLVASSKIVEEETNMITAMLWLLVVLLVVLFLDWLSAQLAEGVRQVTWRD